MEARVKVPKGRGLWSAFWSICSLNVPWEVCWPEGGELDVLEVLGHEPNIVHTTEHYLDPVNKWDGNDGHATTTVDLSLDYHVYAADWSSDTIKWYLDGVKVYETKNNIPTTSSLFSDGKNKHYVLFNLAVGGWAGAPDSATIFPATMSIDYVRVCK